MGVVVGDNSLFGFNTPLLTPQFVLMTWYHPLRFPFCQHESESRGGWIPADIVVNHKCKLTELKKYDYYYQLVFFFIKNYLCWTFSWRQKNNEIKQIAGFSSDATTTRGSNFVIQALIWKRELILSDLTWVWNLYH